MQEGGLVFGVSEKVPRHRDANRDWQPAAAHGNGESEALTSLSSLSSLLPYVKFPLSYHWFFKVVAGHSFLKERLIPTRGVVRQDTIHNAEGSPKLQAISITSFSLTLPDSPHAWPALLLVKVTCYRDYTHFHPWEVWALMPYPGYGCHNRPFLNTEAQRGAPVNPL